MENRTLFIAYLVVWIPCVVGLHGYGRWKHLGQGAVALSHAVPSLVAIQQLDHCTGRVLDALDQRGLAQNTLVILTSDNGAVLTRDVLAVGQRANGG